MLLYFLLMLLRRAPMLLLALGGIGFAIVRWKRHPRASLMTVLGLGLYLVEGFVYTGIIYGLPKLTQGMNLSYVQISPIYTALSVLDDFAFAAVIILLVAAAFAGRKPATDKS